MPELWSHVKSVGAGWPTRLNAFLKTNEIVLRMITANEALVEDMEKRLRLVTLGERRMVTEPAETIVAVERNIRNVEDAARQLRDRLVTSP